MLEIFRTEVSKWAGSPRDYFAVSAEKQVLSRSDFSLSSVGLAHHTQRNTDRIIFCLLPLMFVDTHFQSDESHHWHLRHSQAGSLQQSQKARRSWGFLCLQQIPWSLLILLLMQRNFGLFCQQLFPSRLIWALFQWANSKRQRDPSDTELKQITHRLLPFEGFITEGLQSIIVAQPQGDKHVR